MSKIVFDIETKNFDRNRIPELDVSVVGIYLYDKDEYRAYDERELEELGEVLRNAEMLIGFNSGTFDVPVLEKYYKFKLSAVPHFDILENIVKSFGKRVKLDHLAEANLGIRKSASGAEAINMYSAGEIEKLKDYCLQDVRITKEIFDIIMDKGYLWVPQRNMPQMAKVEIEYQEPETSQQSLI